MKPRLMMDVLFLLGVASALSLADSPMQVWVTTISAMIATGIIRMCFPARKEDRP